MNPARRAAREEWYDALKERDSTLYYACLKRQYELENEQHALPPKERMTVGQRADVIDAMSGINDDPGYFRRKDEIQKEISRKRVETMRAKRSSRKSAPPTESEGPPVITPEEAVPPASPGDLGVVGNPKDILWAVEYLGDESVGRGDAPSGTAWTLLCAGRKSPDSLLRIYQQVCVPSKKDLEDAADESEAFDHLDDVLKRVIEIAERSVA